MLFTWRVKWGFTMRAERLRIPAGWWTVLVLLIAVIGALVSLGAGAAQPGADVEAQSRALQRAHDAVVGVRALALEDTHSNRNLGRARQGSGVVIGADGLVLTIGYLVLEADQVQLVLDAKRAIPARVVAYDVATGFGLLQALAPLRLQPVPIGRTSGIADEEPLMIASGGEDAAVSVARMVSRRPFSGYWEYHLEQALFTVPARPDHSGAGLFNGRGELIGIGSLLVADATGNEGGGRTAGNLFVPAELLPPILDELQAQGRSAASRRAWLGVNCVEIDGAVRVLRVNPESPAELAGLQRGDRIVRIDGAAVDSLERLYKQLWDGGAPERQVVMDVERGGQSMALTLQTVDRMKTLRRARGI
jgi:serine protease Do